MTEIPVERTPVMGRTEVVSLTSDHAADGTVERTPVMGRTVSAADGTVERTPVMGRTVSATGGADSCYGAHRVRIPGGAVSC